LFNGGFFDSPVLCKRLLERIDDWFAATEPDGWEPIVLDNDRLDLAVARGAAYYGNVHRGEGVRIAASLARSYYIAIDDGEGADNPQAVCLVPGDAQPGQSFVLDSPKFQLKLSQPVAFTLLSSSVRLTDQPGQIVETNQEQFSALPSIRTVINAKSRNEKRDVPVRLKVDLTEIGTLNVSCHEVDSERSWKLDFDIRSTVQTDVMSHSGTGEAQGFIDEVTWHQCREAIAAVFGPNAQDSVDPKELVHRLTEILEMPRDEWPMSVLRRIWEALMEHESGRRKSAKHESRWLNLLGFSLRPGFGFAADDWRVTETWRTINGKLAHGTPAIKKESLILWRRLAGGLSRGQQAALASKILPTARNLALQLDGKRFKGIALKPEESPETWRLLGSLERLPVSEKVYLGNLLIKLLDKKSFAKFQDSIVWAIGRLGQRKPTYGDLNAIVAQDHIAPWLSRLIQCESESTTGLHLAVAQTSHLVGDRFRDLDSSRRDEIVRWLEASNASAELKKLVQHGGEFDSTSQQQIFGDSLPVGLKLA